MSVTERLKALRSDGATAANSQKDKENYTPDDVDEYQDIENNKKSKTKKKDLNMTEDELEKAKAVSHDVGFKAANDRMNNVFASEHYEGRESAAKTMLANAKFSAEDITGVLATITKIEPSAIGSDLVLEAAENAARQEMQAAIAKNVNSDILAGGFDDVEDKNNNILVMNMKARFQN